MKYLTKFVKHMRLFQMRIKKNYMMHVEDKKKNKLINRLLEGSKLNKKKLDILKIITFINALSFIIFLKFYFYSSFF